MGAVDPTLIAGHGEAAGFGVPIGAVRLMGTIYVYAWATSARTNNRTSLS